MDELFRALPKLLKEFDDNEELREAVTFAAWRKIAGESLRKHAVPFRLFNKHLIVAVRDNMWKRHLELLSGQMIFKINSVLGQAVVTFIEFRIDEETVLQENKNRAKFKVFRRRIRQKSRLIKLRRNFGIRLMRLKDDNLRYQFLLAAGSCLARKENMKKS